MPYNAEETEALFHAIPRADVKGVLKALENGADPNALRDNPRNSPLMWAALYNQPEIAKALIEHGADIDYRRKGGETALIMAAGLGNSRVCEVLLDHGANILLQHDFNADAMMVAYQEGFRTLGDFLMGKVKEVHRKLDAEWAQNKGDVTGKSAAAAPKPSRTREKGLNA